jgi:hypothetical protein
MNKIIWSVLLGLCLNTSWAQEIQHEDILIGEPALQNTHPLESHPRKFAELTKATMDLMGPELEAIPNIELETNHLRAQTN